MCSDDSLLVMASWRTPRGMWSTSCGSMVNSMMGSPTSSAGTGASFPSISQEGSARFSSSGGLRGWHGRHLRRLDASMGILWFGHGAGCGWGYCSVPCGTGAPDQLELLLELRDRVPLLLHFLAAPPAVFPEGVYLARLALYSGEVLLDLVVL
mmetsp:Transcript_101939/g.288642  ORF Transcript_101939/g.288642 Transcript_101939/m.288642 type:complete len:153 (+) Transcript_101939:609-1067(+)